VRLGQEGLLLGEVRGQGGGASPALLLVKHQEHQLLFLSAHFGRDVMEAEIVPQVLHLHLHELLPPKGCGSDPLAEEAEVGAVPHLA